MARRQDSSREPDDRQQPEDGGDALPEFTDPVRGRAADDDPSEDLDEEEMDDLDEDEGSF